jgi:hypothetical protein
VVRNLNLAVLADHIAEALGHPAHAAHLLSPLVIGAYLEGFAAKTRLSTLSLLRPGGRLVHAAHNRLPSEYVRRSYAGADVHGRPTEANCIVRVWRVGRDTYREGHSWMLLIGLCLGALRIAFDGRRDRRKTVDSK